MRIALGTTIIETSEHQPISVIFDKDDYAKIFADCEGWDRINDSKMYIKELDIHSVCTEFPEEWTEKERSEMLDVLEAKVNGS